MSAPCGAPRGQPIKCLQPLRWPNFGNTTGDSQPLSVCEVVRGRNHFVSDFFAIYHFSLCNSICKSRPVAIRALNRNGWDANNRQKIERANSMKLSLWGTLKRTHSVRATFDEELGSWPGTGGIVYSKKIRRRLNSYKEREREREVGGRDGVHTEQYYSLMGVKGMFILYAHK